MAVTYENIIYDYIMIPLKSIISDDYSDSRPIYISPDIDTKSNFSIRLWPGEILTHNYTADSWTKQYDIEISVYMIDPGRKGQFIKQFFRESERIYQVLFDNAKAKSTTANSTARAWYDGQVENIIFNEYNDEEAEIEGLNVARINFNCKLNR